MPPHHRRPLGPGGGAQPPEQPHSGRQENTGAGGLSRYERAMFGHLIPEPAPPTVHSNPADRQELDSAIDRATQRMSQGKAEALRRAFAGDDSLLLTTRPTNTSNPPRPRTLAAGWDSQSKTLFIRFRGQKIAPGQYEDGIGYEYYGVTRSEWRTVRDGPSPGKYINAVLNSKNYTPASW
ncbi:KTSC domain-containing protein [Streptomyces sp. CBMA29]|uniref:KTSC domain-containing protein n=1 Tax=Streptomyces sp. CBMA29 TaxID=1896314 RepID=UPI001CB6D883|nr:KTSC domain-containing protein [Streptomyces sp. CBMA29]